MIADRGALLQGVSDMRRWGLEGHLLARILRTIAHQVEEYKTPQSVLTKNSDGTRLVIAGFPHLEHNSVIITVSCPNVADIIHKQISYLKNPMSWDYLLYLETTKPGHLLNQLIPCSSETFLDIEIALLQAALTPKHYY